MTEEEFIQKLRKGALFTHSGHQKEILWGRLHAYIDTGTNSGLWHFSFRLAYIATFVFVVLLTSAGVTFASQSSLPGQPLYPVKRWSEEAVIFAKFDDTAKKKARMGLTTRRADEVDKLISHNPEKAEEVLNEYENQIQDYMVIYIDDPNLSQDLEMTLTLNREVLMRAADSAPDNIRIRIRALIETKEELENNTEVKTEEEQDAQDGSTKGESLEKEPAGTINEKETNETSFPRP